MGTFSDFINFDFTCSQIEVIRYIRMIVSMIGVLLLSVLFLNIRSQPGADKSDPGYLLTIGAFIVWIFVDLVYLNSCTTETAEETKRFMSNGATKALSTINNACFLMSLPYYTHAFPAIRNKIKPRDAAIIIGLVGLLVAGTILFNWSDSNKVFFLVLDRTISGVTYTLLLFAIAKGFYKRGYGIPIIIVSAFIFVVLIYTQIVPERGESLNFSYVLFLCSQIGFIIIILLHAFSWRDEVVKNVELQKHIDSKRKNDNDEIARLTIKNAELQKIVDSERKGGKGEIALLTRKTTELQNIVDSERRKNKDEIALLTGKNVELQNLVDSEKESSKDEIAILTAQNAELQNIIGSERESSKDEIAILTAQNAELQNIIDSERERRFGQLSPREREVLSLARENSNQEIAIELGIDVSTVRTYITALEKVSGTKDRERFLEIINNQ